VSARYTEVCFTGKDGAMGKHNLLKLLLIINTLFIFGLVNGCGILPGQIDETEGWSANRLYTEAKEATRSGNYQTAIDYLEKLQTRYPFGRYAQQAQLELIYAYYKDTQPEAAIAAADRFIRTYPRNPFVDYAYYLKGLVNYNRRGESLVTRFLPDSPTKTDTEVTRQSLNDFAELVQRFPNSRYAEDARQRMLFLHQSLATYEINVADYYLRRGAYLAAINRAKHVLENFAQTPLVADALTIMVKAYVGLGLTDLAADSLRVLQLNYPNSPAIPELTALLNGNAEQSSFSLFGLDF
jgi:outer membrane protein assembly factor BamD